MTGHGNALTIIILSFILNATMHSIIHFFPHADTHIIIHRGNVRGVTLFSFECSTVHVQIDIGVNLCAVTRRNQCSEQPRLVGTWLRCGMGTQRFSPVAGLLNYQSPPFPSLT
ncbi:hypothetical protein AG1IA_00728 [Rhizoctonia solani AG-1 IA]|uniref:Uncharacterized protein n=1 Tax=Thanatephorus cucumeris (strain AG1-IA) TaxID=983506 RepID=L8X825_THACA|nr:hypothetical protein AG1IA_00728 [Rhizoctonia solani AG-1 IA]